MTQKPASGQATDNIEEFQDILKTYDVYSLQGWKEVDEIETCFRLLRDLSQRCGAYIHVNTTVKDGDRWRLASVTALGDRLSVYAESWDGDGTGQTREIEFVGVAVSRFALVLLSHDVSPVPLRDGSDDVSKPGVAAVLWHEAFHLQDHHIDELVRHFS